MRKDAFEVRDAKGSKGRTNTARIIEHALPANIDIPHVATTRVYDTPLAGHTSDIVVMKMPGVWYHSAVPQACMRNLAHLYLSPSTIHFT